MLNLVKKYLEWDLKVFLKIHKALFRAHKDWAIMGIVMIPFMTGAKIDMRILSWIDTKRGLN